MEKSTDSRTFAQPRRNLASREGNEGPRDGRIGILPVAEQQDDLRRRIARKRTGQAEHIVDAPRALWGPREDDPSADRTQDSRESRSQTWRCPLQEERIERMANHRAR